MATSGQEPGRPTVFEATITAPPEVFAELDDLDLDVLPARKALDDGRFAVEALVRPEQLAALVAAGAKVELRRVVDQQFPRGHIMSAEQARSGLSGLRQLRANRD
jgi:hypothetical protein